jgi:hypothetical protein
MIQTHFLEQQQAIIAYIQEHYPDYLLEGFPVPTRYVNDFLDFDKYLDNFTVFFDFGLYNFNSVTNESERQEATVSVYLALRNDTAEKLKENILRCTAAFYQMFDNSSVSFEGVVDYGKIESIAFYDAVEGHKNLKVAEITFSLTSEV